MKWRAGRIWRDTEIGQGGRKIKAFSFYRSLPPGPELKEEPQLGVSAKICRSHGYALLSAEVTLEDAIHLRDLTDNLYVHAAAEVRGDAYHRKVSAVGEVELDPLRARGTERKGFPKGLYPETRERGCSLRQEARISRSVPLAEVYHSLSYREWNLSIRSRSSGLSHSFRRAIVFSGRGSGTFQICTCPCV
jgi:hypothetical protein